MVKHFKNILFRNQWADFNENWYEASETQANYILFNDNPRLALTYFTARSIFYNLGFYIRNVTMVLLKLLNHVTWNLAYIVN